MSYVILSLWRSFNRPKLRCEMLLHEYTLNCFDLQEDIHRCQVQSRTYEDGCPSNFHYCFLSFQLFESLRSPCDQQHCRSCHQCSMRSCPPWSCRACLSCRLLSKEKWRRPILRCQGFLAWNCLRLLRRKSCLGFHRCRLQHRRQLWLVQIALLIVWWSRCYHCLTNTALLGIYSQIWRHL